MRQSFPGWYPRSAEDIATLWNSAIFVPDANVLLHCLRHPAPVRDELIRVLQVLKDSIWIPYQVGLEFHRNRLDVEHGAQDAYDGLIKDQEGVLEKARERLRQLRAHPLISVERELAALDMFASDFRERMLAAKAAHPVSDIASAVERLTELLDTRVGARLAVDQLAAIKKEGDERYAKRVPPGYKDQKKDAGEYDKYGDLIIWKEMIAKAKADARPVIFISDDAKEDWWWIHRGRKLGPRPELIEEFLSGSGQPFHMYEFGQFLRFAALRHPEIRPGVEQVEKSLLEDERARRRGDEASEAERTAALVRELEDERDHIVATLSGLPGVGAHLSTDRPGLRVRLAEISDQLNTLPLAHPRPDADKE